MIIGLCFNLLSNTLVYLSSSCYMNVITMQVTIYSTELLSKRILICFMISAKDQHVLMP